eukprot:TRINITY_DN1043_c0_g1_i1.p1 TRINITY_DN1043_c0_g1~~TRINITY_DN1043_c0_g1_i1.p1  ORF type:complete len:611 (-),score=205.89 TRINITY_DN1043_c0_g1_i1:503-2335(-)
MVRTKYLLVVGEAGDGKSTLIKNLKLPEEKEPRTGRSVQGVTKQLGIYRARPLDDGTPVVLLDTPGIGDNDVTPMRLIAMIEEVLKAEGFQEQTGGGLDGILVTSPTNKPRFGLGERVVKILVDKGFVGEKKWDSVILVGTKHDKAEEEDVAAFMKERVPLFFKESDGKGQYAFTNLQDSSKALEAVLSLPNKKVTYEAPAAEEFANAVAELMGMDKDALTKELAAMREAAAKEVEGLKAEVAEVQRQIEEKELEAAQQRHAESQRQEEFRQLQQQQVEHSRQQQHQQEQQLKSEAAANDQFMAGLQEQQRLEQQAHREAAKEERERDTQRMAGHMKMMQDMQEKQNENMKSNQATMTNVMQMVQQKRQQEAENTRQMIGTIASVAGTVASVAGGPAGMAVGAGCSALASGMGVSAPAIPVAAAIPNNSEQPNVAAAQQVVGGYPQQQVTTGRPTVIYVQQPVKSVEGANDASGDAKPVVAAAKQSASGVKGATPASGSGKPAASAAPQAASGVQGAPAAGGVAKPAVAAAPQAASGVQGAPAAGGVAKPAVASAPQAASNHKGAAAVAGGAVKPAVQQSAGGVKGATTAGGSEKPAVAAAPKAGSVAKA